jgi:hypothetical protein
MLLLSLRQKWSTLWQMSWGDRWVAAQSFVLLPAIALSLSLVGLPTTQRYLAQLSPVVKTTTEVQMTKALGMAHSVNRAANHSPLWGNCLKRSLTLWFLLRRQGIESDLCIGVDLQDGQFQAHAWIEYSSHILNDQPTVHQQFKAFEKPFEPGF